jgi:chemotaxis protein CheZ
MSDHSKVYGRGQVIEIIQSVMSKVSPSSPEDSDIYLQIAELSSTIENLKREIAASRPDHVSNSHVPDAREELNAVVTSTADATNSIMSACEEMEQMIASGQSADKEAMVALVTKVYEACTFQDITGQRIRKVIATLLEIESKVQRIMETISEKVGPVKVLGERIEKPVSIEDSKSLLHGPQLAGQGVSQDDIDKLLAEFDK